MKAFVTGVTGSLGGALLKLLLEDSHEVVGFSRDELKQSTIPKHDKLTLYLGDIRNKDRLLEASRGADVIFNLAAMKRIEMSEEQPEEAIATNVQGTENVLFAQRMNKIPRVILVSTDKSCLPITAYGATKFLAERLVLRNPNNVVARYGNVLASRGSILPLFQKSIQQHGVVHITDRRCSRFWWSLNEAATFVYLCAVRPSGGLMIPNLKAYPVVGLANLLAQVLGCPPPDIVEVGLRCREKIHEQMRTDEEGGEMTSEDQRLWFSKAELKEMLASVVAR